MYKYERYYFRMFTPLMGIMFLIFAIYGEWIGAVISTVLGILVSFSYQGIIVDGEQERYLKYDRIVTWKIGRWEPLSTPLYVTIVRVNLSALRTIPSPLPLPDNKKGAKAYKVNLVVEGNSRYVTICRGGLEPMKKEALKLGSALNIRVLDYTTHHKHWIL